MSAGDRHPRRGLEHETAGSVDYPFDTDPQAVQPRPRSDAACTIPWRADGFEAVQVFVDPALRERAGELCATVSTLAGAHQDLDTLGDRVLEYGEHEGLSASVYEDPGDDPSRGVVAIAFTMG